MNLFKGWPNDNLLQVSSGVFGREIEPFPRESLVPSSLFDLTVASGLSMNLKRKIPASIWARLGSIYRKMRGIGRITGGEFICRNYTEILDSVRAFKPDVIYARVSEYPLYSVRLPRLVASHLNVPMVCHIMDDCEQVFTLSRSRFERAVIRRIYRWQLKKLFSAAAANIAISRSMAEAFSVRYERVFSEIHNGVDPNEWCDIEPGSRTASSSGTPFRVVLAGAIKETKDRAVVSAVGKSIANLNAREPDRYELLLNTPQSSLAAAYKIAKYSDGVIVQSFLPTGEYHSLLRGADVLILARNFDDESRAYTQYSFHNKLPEYLASGTAIVCIGPEWCNSVRYLERNDAGIVIKNDSVEAIGDAIKFVRRNPREAAEMATTAHRLAFAEFDVRDIRRRFRDTLIRAVEGEAA